MLTSWLIQFATLVSTMGHFSVFKAQKLPSFTHPINKSLINCYLGISQYRNNLLNFKVAKFRAVQLCSIWFFLL